jgi:hypothetical protein
MKYFGNKSLSAFLSIILPVIWWIVLLGSIVFAVMLVLNTFSISFGDPVTSGIARSNFFGEDSSWNQVLAQTIALKSLILVALMAWFAVIVVLLLLILKKARQLFTNFRNDVVFKKNNVLIISRIGKLLIVFSIFTFNLTALLIAVFLLMLCEIIKNGTALQEEHDLTV